MDLEQDCEGRYLTFRVFGSSPLGSKNRSNTRRSRIVAFVGSVGLEALDGIAARIR